MVTYRWVWRIWQLTNKRNKVWRIWQFTNQRGTKYDVAGNLPMAGTKCDVTRNLLIRSTKFDEKVAYRWEEQSSMWLAYFQQWATWIQKTPGERSVQAWPSRHSPDASRIPARSRSTAWHMVWWRYMCNIAFDAGYVSKMWRQENVQYNKDSKQHSEPSRPRKKMRAIQ